MKCTNKKRFLCLAWVFSCAVFLLGGCGTKAVVEIPDPYPVYDLDLGKPSSEPEGSAGFFGEELCCAPDINFGMEEVHSEYAESAGVFNLDTREVRYSQNIFKRMYPASTTKIMTAYLILKYDDLNAIATVSAQALDIDEKSTTCGLKEGDSIRVEDLLYGLMLVSGNDAANVLAEHYAGSIDAFVELMNQEAGRIGATNTHFVTTNGLSDENHYTTVYDMYLIMAEAMKTEGFAEITSTKNRQVTYTSETGKSKTVTWKNSNRYLTGDAKLPEGMTLLGGKTGTTVDAGYCLVLCTRNEKNEQIISIVFKAETRSYLYDLMTQILERFAK